MADDIEDDSERTFHPHYRCGAGHLHGRTADGQLGLLAYLPEGQPIPEGSELVDARLRDGAIRLRTLYRRGPARVATREYREGYDAIFGRRPRGQA